MSKLSEGNITYMAKCIGGYVLVIILLMCFGAVYSVYAPPYFAEREKKAYFLKVLNEYKYAKGSPYAEINSSLLLQKSEWLLAEIECVTSGSGTIEGCRKRFAPYKAECQRKINSLENFYVEKAQMAVNIKYGTPKKEELK